MGETLSPMMTQFTHIYIYIDGLVQDCNISSVLAMEILQSCTKPSIYELLGFKMFKHEQPEPFLAYKYIKCADLYSNKDVLQFC